MDKIMIFGAGQGGRMISNWISSDYHLLGFIDNNSLLWDTKINNLKVYSLQEAVKMIPEIILVIVLNRDGALEIDDENGYILQVKEEHLDIVEKLCPVELKPPVLKTLTVIALKEPIRQAYLKELRSNAYEHVQELLDKGLISRTKDKNGRSFNIRTTPKFAEYFKLKGDLRTLMKSDINKLLKTSTTED